MLPQIEIVNSANDVAKEADCILILTEWPEFQRLDWRSLANAMRQRCIIDTRNILVPEQICSYGFDYLGMGRPSSPAHQCRNR